MSDHWKSLADRLGAPSLNPSQRRSLETSETTEVEDATTDSIAPQPSEATLGTAPSSGGRARAGEPRGSSSSASKNAPEPAKKKKRSNWERVTSLFGLGPEPDDQEEGAQEHAQAAVEDAPATEAPTTKAPQRETSIDSNRRPWFDPSAADDANPVLEEMFGHGQKPVPEAWDRPKRVVDDIGWETESAGQWSESSESQPTSRMDSTSKLGEDAPTQSESSEGEEGDPSRNRPRRRRRRSRRGGTSLPDRDVPASEAERRIEGLDDTSEVEVERSLESDEELSDHQMPERRSARRRRHRGGDRSAKPMGSSTRGDTVNEPERESQGSDQSPRSEHERKKRPSERDEFSSESRNRHRTRDARSSRPEVSDESHARSVESESASAPDSLDDSGEESGSETRHSQKSHRNIPTWEETLSSLITSNIENHRRNENRGYRGGGRSKGRR